MNILYYDPVINTETSRKYKYYEGLYNELCKIKTVNVFHYNSIDFDLDRIQNKNNFKADVVIFGLGFFGTFNYFGKIKNTKNIPIIVILFKPQNNLNEKLNFCKINNVNRILTPIPDYYSYEKQTGIKTILFNYGYDLDQFHPRDNICKKYDIGFSGALHNGHIYPAGSFPVKNIREKINKLLASIKEKNNLKVFWKSSDNYEQSRIHSLDEYSKTINSSKAWIATQASYGDITPRYYEVLGSGTLLFCQEIHPSYNNILKDNINCVTFRNDLSDFEEKLIYYLTNKNEYNKIIENAVNFSSKSLTWLQKAKDAISIIKGI